LCRNYDDPSAKVQVETVEQFFIDHMVVMKHVYPTVAKCFLQKRGLEVSSFTRRFVGVFDEGVKGKVDALYGNYQQLYDEIGLRLTV